MTTKFGGASVDGVGAAVKLAQAHIGFHMGRSKYGRLTTPISKARTLF